MVGRVGSNQGIRHEKYMSDDQIIINSAPHFAVGIVVDYESGVDDVEKRKRIVRAGTPMYGDLDDRETPFKATGTGTPAGILQHDCDVSVTDGNGDLLLIGVVNLDRVHEETQALITSDVKSALPTIKLLHLD